MAKRSVRYLSVCAIKPQGQMCLSDPGLTSSPTPGAGGVGRERGEQVAQGELKMSCASGNGRG